ncbi:MAG: HEAT repeat domain-containing protein, partial [Thermoplasmata archaeon]
SIQLSEPEVVHTHLVNGDFEAWLRKNSNWDELANMLASISRKCVEDKINAEDAKTLLISYLRRTPAEGVIYEHTIKPLIKKLESRDEQTLIETANKLGMIGDERAVEPLIGRLSDSSVKVRSAIMHALGKIGDISATPFIIKVIKNSISKEDRINAIRAAGMLKDERAVDVILEYMIDNDTEISREAIRALGEIGSAKAISKLKEVANGENENAKIALDILRTKQVVG